MQRRRLLVEACISASRFPSILFLFSLSLAILVAAAPVLAGTPVAQISTENGASSDSNIQLENWAKPEPGWLYVLDPKPETGGPGGRIWLVDPETAKVMGSIRTGDNADFALSPDGRRLYVASITNGDSSELAVIDATQGLVLQRGEIEDREVANVLPAFSTMAVFRRWAGAAHPDRHAQIGRRGFVSAGRLRHADWRLFAADRALGELWPRPLHFLSHRRAVRLSLSKNE
jgi:hypothetical protein